jgi:hypothetical protein
MIIELLELIVIVLIIIEIVELHHHERTVNQQEKNIAKHIDIMQQHISMEQHILNGRAY